jgi:hypothetical protein
MTGDGAVRFTLELKSAVSAFANTLGVYKIGADGTISDVQVLFANTLNVAAGAKTVDLGVLGNGQHFGFFLIQDGANLFNAPTGTLSFVTPGRTRRPMSTSGCRPPGEFHPGRAQRPPDLPFLRQPQSQRAASRSCPASSRVGSSCISASRICRWRRAIGLPGRRRRHPRQRRRLLLHLMRSPSRLRDGEADRSVARAESEQIEPRAVRSARIRAHW